MAALWRLPLLLVCENNGWAEFSRSDRQLAFRPAALAAAYDIPHCEVDGADVLAVAAAAEQAVAALRDGQGPRMIEARTRRWRGHFEGDPQRYRDPAEADEHAAHDPIARLRAALLASGTEAGLLEKLETECRAAIADAIAAARAAPEPRWEDARAGVYAAAEG
jgi:pyruvate dehydrogenase E1 component alpha subunit